MIGLLLKESDCDVDHREHHGWAALHEASRQGNRQVIQMLLKAKAHTNILTNLGETPIYIGQSHTSLGLHTSAKSFAQNFVPPSIIHLTIVGTLGFQLFFFHLNLIFLMATNVFWKRII